jgi:hypothetical protein
MLSYAVLHNHSQSPEKSGYFALLFFSLLVCVKENENRLFCKDFTDRIQPPPTLFLLTLRDSLFSHGNILNSLKLSFPRLNWDERGLVVIMKFFLFYYSSTRSTVSSKMLLVCICKWGVIRSIECTVYSQQFLIKLSGDTDCLPSTRYFRNSEGDWEAYLHNFSWRSCYGCSGVCNILAQKFYTSELLILITRNSAVNDELTKKYFCNLFYFDI